MIQKLVVETKNYQFFSQKPRPVVPILFYMRYEYKHWKPTQKILESIVHIDSTLSEKDSLEFTAFVTRNGSTKSSYKVYVSRFAESNSFLLHEYGHIIFQHLRFEQLNLAQTQERFDSIWPSLKKQIEFESTFDVESQTKSALFHILQNYAMDMEVNSKLFDEDERERVDFDATNAEFKKMKWIVDNTRNASVRKALNRFLEKYKKNKKERLVTCVWPEDYKFGRKLHWLQYLDLILASPQTMQKIISQVQEEMCNCGEGDPVEFGKASSSNLIKASKKNDNKVLEGNEKVEESSESDTPGKGHQNSKTKSFKVHPLGPQVKKFITSKIIDEFKDAKSDILYNYNRGKTGNVLRYKTVEHIDYYTQNCYIIVDTSGSVSSTRLIQLISLFDEIKPFVGANSKVIFWDTGLQRVDKLRNKITNPPRGGGTQMSGAIEYVSKMTTHSDKVFIISDYIDFLSDWLKAYKKLNCQMYGICWTPKDSLSNRFLSSIEDFVKEVETLFVQL